MTLLGMPFKISPTNLDLEIARTIAWHTRPGIERAVEIATWGADENLLVAAAVAWWLYTRQRPRQRLAANHVLLTTVAASVLPHLLKAIFNKRRPDRLTVLGHLHGVPISGNPLDAFPSGHAVHVGALASAAARLPRTERNAVWSIGAGLLATRVVLLAHWASDVVAGLAIGVALERLLRRLTGFGADSR
ncbi:phosphatase PAP2 family protein [Bradyrhizobium sp. 157]|nr:phosphatase PAP2 family protein [Bradyrhizobium sp. 157]